MRSIRHCKPLLVLAACIIAAPAVAADDPPRASVPDDYEVLLAGDIVNAAPILPWISRNSRALAEMIQHADAAFGNFENTAIDWSRYQGSPQAEAGGDWLLATADVPRDLKALGFDIVSRANNHGTDWGVDGLRLTDQLLDEADLTHAGSAATETAARAPAFHNGAKARVALVATTVSFNAASRAADPRGVVPGRAGVSAIDLQRVVLVSPEHLAVLADVRDQIARDLFKPVDPDRQSVDLFGAKFKALPGGNTQASVQFDANDADEKDVLRSVRQARRTADLVLLSVHWHEPSNQADTAAPFAVNLAHAAIDNGADVVVGHGPHRLRGIELYKGRPIFYSLANFAFQLRPMQPMPRDEFRSTGMNPDTALDEEPIAAHLRQWSNGPIWYDSVVATVRYKAGVASEIRLYPVELGYADTGVAQGIPRLAAGADARRILTKLQTLSRPLGTDIVVRGAVGTITLDRTAGK